MSVAKFREKTAGVPTFTLGNSDPMRENEAFE
jgi:hypothetical protein